MKRNLRVESGQRKKVNLGSLLSVVVYRVILVCVVAGSGSTLATTTVSGTGSPDGVTLTNVAQILALTADATQSHPPVQIRGMLTYYENGVALFVQDESAGIYVYHTGSPLNITPGQYIEVTGMANRGRYSPIIDSPKIRVIEGGPVIRPKPVTLDEINLGGLDAQWVQLKGVVRNQRFGGDGLYLDLAMGDGRISVRMPGIQPKDVVHTKFEGSIINVTGVVGTLNGKEQDPIGGFQIFANGAQDCAILQLCQGNAFSLPRIEVGDLNKPQIRREPTGRVCLSGVVTLCWPGRRLFVQDSSGGVAIQTKTTPEALEPGDVIEVDGFLGPFLAGPRIEDAVVRKVGIDRIPKPDVLLSEDLLQGHHNQELVELEATFVEWANRGSSRPGLGLQAQGHFLTAQLNLAGNRRGVLPALEPGCRVRLTGVACVTAGLPGIDPSLCLLLPSPAGISVVGTSPLAHPAGVEIPVAIASLTGTGLAVALWYTRKQKRRTERVLQLQATLQAEMLQGEQQLRRSMEERDRIGRDLHDDIIQSIYAVGLNLEDCRRVVRQSPEKAEARVVAAIETLNSTIRNVRGFLSGLEPKVVNGREFKTALKSLALTSGEGPPPFQIEVDPSAANSLTSAQATQLLHIAKEAMSNSLRHGQASVVNVSLYPVSTGVHLEVRDNGAGFVPESTPGTGHGLRNMAARAREIGADLQISSAPGRGCRILVDVPQRNTNERS